MLGLLDENDFSDLKNKLKWKEKNIKIKKLSDVQPFEKHLLKKEYIKRCHFKRN